MTTRLTLEDMLPFFIYKERQITVKNRVFKVTLVFTVLKEVRINITQTRGVLCQTRNGKLQQLLEINSEIEQVKDVDVLLEKILSVARKLANADAGSIYVTEGNCLKFSHTQNETLQQRLVKS